MQIRAAPVRPFHGIPRNRLLITLPPADFERIRSRLEFVTLQRGSILQDFDRAPGHVYFIESGLVSIQAHTGRDRPVEVGLLGQCSLVGTSAALGGYAPLRAVMQVAGEALVMDAKSFRAAVVRSPSMLQLLLHDLQAFTVQSSHLVLCNAKHDLEQRVARWLLLAQDWLEADQIPITHALIGDSLGVRRAGVTEALSRFEHAGAISTERACITVLDRDRLQGFSCDCYRCIRREYSRTTLDGV